MTTIPTIAEIRANLLAAFESEFGVIVNTVGLSVFNALSTVIAGIMWLYYLGLAKVQKNIWYDTADSEANGGTLERFGRSILGRSPFPATAGRYSITVTGSIGATIPASTVYRADDSSESPGALFQINAVHVMVTTSDTVQVNSLVGGTASSLEVGDTLTATAPIININPGAVVVSEDIAPINAETTEEYRAKINNKVQLEPGSWSAVDYRLVGDEIPGVGQTYAYNESGESATVHVYLQGTTPVANPGPSVSPSVLTAYETALELVLPLGVFNVIYDSSTIRNVDVTITMGTFPAFTTAQKAAIASALTSFVNSVHPFIAACDVVSQRNDVIATYNLISAIAAAVPGLGFSAVTFDVASTTVTDWTADNGEIPFLNSITYA